MAVKIKSNSWWIKVHEAAGVPAQKTNLIKGSSNAEVTTSSTMIKYFCDGSLVSSVTVNNGALSNLVDDKLGKASKAAIQFKIMKAVDQAIPHLKTTGTTTMQVQPPFDPSAPYHVLEGSKSVLKGASITIEKSPNQAKKVALINAKALYQPVKSTSETSTYYAVVFGDYKGHKINGAIRYKVGNLSFRVESNHELSEKEIEFLGVNKTSKPSDSVWAYSLHLSVGDDHSLCSRTFGALVGSFLEGFDNADNHVLPSFKVIKQLS